MSHILYILFIFRCASLYFNLLVAHCEWSSESLFSRSRIGASLSRFLCYIKSLGLKSSGVQNKLSPFEYKWKRILSQLEDVGTGGLSQSQLLIIFFSKYRFPLELSWAWAKSILDQTSAIGLVWQHDSSGKDGCRWQILSWHLHTPGLHHSSLNNIKSEGVTK